MKLQTLIASFAALAGVTTAQAETYYWDKSAAEGAFADKSKWFLDAECSNAANTVPGSEDVAVVSSPVAMALADTSSNIGTFTMNADVTFVAGAIHFGELNGTGKLTVESTVSFVSTVENAQVNVPIDIPAGQTLITRTSGATYKGFQFNAAITGKGLLRTGVLGQQRQYTFLYGDMSAFEGSVEIVDDGIPRHEFRLGPQGSSAKARWSGKNNDTGSMINQAGTYAFGAIEATVYQAKTKDYSFNKDVVFEIGALNSATDSLSGQLSRDGNRTDDGAQIRKVGKGTLSLTASGVQAVHVVDGTVRIAADTALSYADNNKSIKAYIDFVNAGVLKVAPEVTRDVSGWLKNSTAPIVFDDEGNNWTWSTALSSSNTAGFRKLGNGTLTLAKIPQYKGVTVVEGGTLQVPVDTTIDELTVVEGAKLAVTMTTSYETPTKVLTIKKLNLADGQSYADVIPNTATTSFEFDLDESSGEVKVLATRGAATFEWSGAAQDGLWDSVGNWTLNGATATEMPKMSDTVVFAQEATVMLTAERLVTALVANAKVTLSGANLRLTEVYGEGSVSLGDNAGLSAYDQRDSKLTVSLPLEITAAVDKPARVEGYWKRDSSGGSKLNLTDAKLSGNGAVTFKACRATIQLPADMTEFAGSLEIQDDTSMAGGQRVNVSVTPEQVSAKQVWTVYNYGHVGQKDATFLLGSDTKFVFGALNGSVMHGGTQSEYLRNVVEVGAREDVDSTLGGNFFINNYPDLVASRGVTIRKVGAGSTLNFSGLRVRAFEIEAGVLNVMKDSALQTTWTDKEVEQVYVTPITFAGGTLKLADDVTVDPSAAIAKSSGAISVDTAVDRTWATAIADSNVGGLVKKGAGTLTLSAVPAYAGVTTVEAGELVVPAESRIHWDILSAGTLTGGTKASFNYQVGTTNVYDSAAATPSAGNHTLNLDNLVAIDLTSVTTVERNSKFVIAEAKAFNVDGKAITKAGREKIELVWGEGTTFPTGKTSADYTLQVVNGQLVVANKAVGIAIIIK